MPYASESDLRIKWGSEAIDLLAWNAAAQAPDEARIAAALANGAAIIDSYLARRYALPVNPAPDAAQLLLNLNCDLTAPMLAVTPGTRNELLADAEKRALAFLRDVAEGKAALNLILPPSAGAPISPGEAVMLDQAGGSLRSRLRGL